MPSSPRILVATDFSRAAHLAVARAARFATAAAARLDVVHAARPLSRTLLAWLRGTPEGSKLLDSARQQLDDVVASARHGGADARGHLVTGAPVATIEASCRRLKADLAVLGARGTRSLRDHLVGTTAERLIERLPCDVLVVRRSARTAYRVVLACVDTSPAAAHALRRAMKLAPDARTHVLHVYEPPLAGVFRSYGLHEQAAEYIADERQKARESLVKFLRDAEIDERRVKIELKTGYPPSVIERTAARLRPDLVAVGHHTSPVAQQFLGSVAKQVLRLDVGDVVVARRCE